MGFVLYEIIRLLALLEAFIIKKTIRYAYGPKKLSEMVRKKPPMI